MTADDTATSPSPGTTVCPRADDNGRAAQHYIHTVTSSCAERHDRALEPCELSFDFSVHNMFTTWHAGASLHVLPANRVMNAVKFARTERLTVWNSVPSLVGMLRQVKALAPGVLPDLRVTVLGGEQLPEAVVSAWRSAAPNSAIHNIYGPTEPTVCCLKQGVGEPTAPTPGRDSVAIGVPLRATRRRSWTRRARRWPMAPPASWPSRVCSCRRLPQRSELSRERFPRCRPALVPHGRPGHARHAGRVHWLGRIEPGEDPRPHLELEEVDAHVRQAARADFAATVACPCGGRRAGPGGFRRRNPRRVDQVVAELRARLPPTWCPAA